MKISTCQEDWNQMTPNAEGRHCDICNLTVLNLKDKSKDDIELLKEDRGKICGRVSKVQLSEFQYLHPMKRFAIALFLVFGTGLFTTSYSQVIKENQEQSVQENEFVIKFRAEHKNGTPLQGVYINFDAKNDYKEGATDERGELTLSYSAPVQEDKIFINITYGEIYGTLNFEVNSDNINALETIVFDPDSYTLKVGEHVFYELYIIGDVAPIEWDEKPLNEGLEPEYEED
jgi:hypothetical protein